MPAIADWLRAHNLGQYATVFAENEVDFQTLQILTDADLKELGLAFGPRKRLLNALEEHRRSEAASPVDTPVGERRQLTALFCDMVGYTGIANRLDPEILQTVIRSYEDACAVCITRYDGYVFQRLGDGIVAFFGFPLAHEGEAERAIRAGLQILETFAGLEVPAVGRLEVRVGIATGMVVVASGERGAVGETMNLAARLQGLARPGTLVVSGGVRRMAGGAFDYEDLGERALKGIAQPTRIYRVLGESAAVSRFDAATGAGLTPLVGRDHEIGTLLERWSLATAGAGQLVLLSGEAGIGKSRVLRALGEGPELSGVTPLRFQCSPFHVNSAFYPIIANFERVLAFDRDASPDEKLDKLEALVAGHYSRSHEDVRFIAAMLSLPCEARYGPLGISPRLAKAQTTRVLVDIVKAAARAQPALMFFEDAHWADPTSLEVMEKLLAELGGTPLLVVLTHRPEFQPRWTGPNVTALNLAKLAPAQSRALIESLAGKPLPPELAGQIVDRTDGVPLFVEELTKTMLESGAVRDEGDRYVLADTAADVAVPETLRDSLMARLDRAAPVKEIAQVGAAIGRQFSYELLAALKLMPEAALARGLAALTESELAHERGTIPDAVYTFKHALVQDAAYDSLLKSQRQPLHAKIARALEERWPETRDSEPELLAHHYTAAGLAQTAVPFWRRAGEVAMKRFAIAEAVTHLRKGMTLVETLPSVRERDEMELALRTALGPAVVAQRGWAQSEVSRVLEPAWALAESLEHRPAYLPVLNALWVHYMCLDKLAISLDWAQKLLSAGAAARDGDLEIIGHRAASASHYWLGDFAAARRHGDIVQGTYDRERHWHIVQLTNTDPLTGEGIYRSQYLWMLGYPDQAVAATEANDAHARRRNHPFDLAFALTLGAQAFDFRCEPGPLLERTAEAERVGREHGVALLYEVMAQISRGVAALRAGRAEEAVGELDKGTGRLAATGHRIWIAYLKALQAEGLALTGDLAGAAALIEECVARIESGEERAHYAEVLRLKGWILARQGKIAEAEAVLRAAIDVARRQQAKSWELRAATTLARLLADRGEREPARELVAGVYGWFTEGFETKDLREAKALFDALTA